MDCIVGDTWSTWSRVCFPTSDGGLCDPSGVQYRSRVVVTQPTDNGAPCPSISEAQPCLRLLPESCVQGSQCPTSAVAGVRDGGETDVDCGGPGLEPACARCGAGQACTLSSDCALGLGCGQLGTCVSTTQAITDPTAVLVGGSLSLAGDALSRELLLGPGPNTALRTAIVEHLASFGLPMAFDDVLIVSVGVANGTASAGGQQRRLRLLSTGVFVEYVIVTTSAAAPATAVAAQSDLAAFGNRLSSQLLTAGVLVSEATPSSVQVVPYAQSALYIPTPPPSASSSPTLRRDPSLSRGAVAAIVVCAMAGAGLMVGVAMMASRQFGFRRGVHRAGKSAQDTTVVVHRLPLTRSTLVVMPALPPQRNSSGGVDRGRHRGPPAGLASIRDHTLSPPYRVRSSGGRRPALYSAAPLVGTDGSMEAAGASSRSPQPPTGAQVNLDDATLHAVALRSSRNPLRDPRTSTEPVCGDLPLTQLEHPLSPGAARVAAALAYAAPLPSTARPPHASPGGRPLR